MEELLTTVRYAIELLDEMQEEVKIAREELEDVVKLVESAETANDITNEMPFGMDISWEINELIMKLDETQDSFNRLLR